MLAAVRSAAVLGIDAYDVTVEVDVALGLPQWTVVGLPAGAVKESRERVGAAIVNAGFTVPPRRVTVNLAPGHIRKEGTAFDLPIAIGFLAATGQISGVAIAEAIFVGELGLDGTLRACRGALPVARLAAAQRRTLVLPPGNAHEAGLLGDLDASAPATLGALVRDLRVGPLSPLLHARPAPVPPLDSADDFADIVGQDAARRALEVAAAGGHNLLLVGPPGAGKTMLARRLPSILPPLTESEQLEVMAIHSVAGLLDGDGVVRRRPFRAPHHSVSAAGLIGGGSSPRPGEVSLAHHGVLFLDEMLEFPRRVLDSLRQPLEDGRVVVTRAAATAAFPARFTLVGAMNPCPCGHAGDPRHPCRCAEPDIARYRARLSGPLADRIDMHVQVGAVPVRSLGARRAGEPSTAIAARVHAARAVQRRRYTGMSHVACNSQVAGRWIDAETGVDAAARRLLADAAERLGLSARGYHRVLKVARTIADLAGDDAVGVAAVGEALRYRPAVRDAAGAPSTSAARAIVGTLAAGTPAMARSAARRLA